MTALQQPQILHESRAKPSSIGQNTSVSILERQISSKIRTTTELLDIATSGNWDVLKLLISTVLSNNLKEESTMVSNGKFAEANTDSIRLSTEQFFNTNRLAPG